MPFDEERPNEGNGHGNDDNHDKLAKLAALSLEELAVRTAIDLKDHTHGELCVGCTMRYLGASLIAQSLAFDVVRDMKPQIDSDADLLMGEVNYAEVIDDIHDLIGERIKVALNMEDEDDDD